MANIKLKDKNGTDVIYNNISTLTVPTDEDLTATFYETAPSNLQEKSVDITANGSLAISPDEEYDGMSKVYITTYVPPTFSAYKFLSPDATTKPTQSGTATEETVFTAGGATKVDAVLATINFPSESTLPPLICVTIIGGHSAFQITPTPTENYSGVFYSWQELSAEQAAGYGVNLAAGVTIPSGWSVALYDGQNITACTEFDTSASTVKIADNANIRNDFFKQLFVKADAVSSKQDTICLVKPFVDGVAALTQEDEQIFSDNGIEASPFFNTLLAVYVDSSKFGLSYGNIMMACTWMSGSTLTFSSFGTNSSGIDTVIYKGLIDLTDIGFELTKAWLNGEELSISEAKTALISMVMMSTKKLPA